MNNTEKKADSKVAVIAAIVSNVLVGIVKFLAAAITGSSAMLSEGVHSIVDSGNDILILVGMKQAKRPADETHPYGYGKELYYWAMIVALLIFLLGGGIAIYDGIKAIRGAGANLLTDPTLNYIIILISACIEGTSLYVGIKQFNVARGKTRPLKFIRETEDPSLYTVVLEDSAAEVGLILAFLGVFIGHTFNNPYADGIASICIGLLLVVVAMILLKETHGLLIGEGMKHNEILKIKHIVESNNCITKCGRVLTMYAGPDNLIVMIEAAFEAKCDSKQILLAIDEMEAAIHKIYPKTVCVSIEAKSFREAKNEFGKYNSEFEDTVVLEPVSSKI